MSFFNGWFNRKSSIQNPKSGLFHYRLEGEDEKSRVHLRLDPDGHGTLIVNANRIMHLNPTAALMAYLLLEKSPESDAVSAIRKQYHVSADQARPGLLTAAELERCCSEIRECVRPFALF